MRTTGFADRTDLIPPGDNRPGTKLSSFRAFVVHETDNEKPGATAYMHKLYWSPGGGGRSISSVHFVADGNESIQIMPTDEVAWHAGDATGNMTAVGAEICVNSRAGYAAACRRIARIAARVLHDHGLQPIDGVTVRKHGSYAGTSHRACPRHLNAGDWGLSWGTFVRMVQEEYATIDTSPVNYEALWKAKHAEIAYVDSFGFPGKYRAEYNAGRPLGAALSHELGETIVYQVFEHGVLRLDKKSGQITVLR